MTSSVRPEIRPKNQQSITFSVLSLNWFIKPWKKHPPPKKKRKSRKKIIIKPLTRSKPNANRKA